MGRPDTDKMGEITRKMDEDDGEGAGPGAPETVEPVDTPPEHGGPSRWRRGSDESSDGA